MSTSPRHQLTDLDPKQFGYQYKNDFVFDCMEGKRKNLWYLDSRCSRHMTEDSTLPTEIMEGDGLSLTFGDDIKGYTM